MRYTCVTQFMVSGLWLVVNSTGHAMIYEDPLLVYGSCIVTRVFAP